MKKEEKIKTNWGHLGILILVSGFFLGTIFWVQKISEIPLENLFRTEDLVIKENSGDGDENKDKKEIVDEVMMVPKVDEELVKQKIEEGKEFLLRMEHPKYHGFYKKYDALNDSFEPKLHTVYSASIIYTLLKVYDFDKDKRILDKIPQWADFLLFMQSKEKETLGAFHYSFYFEKKEKQLRFVVGTAGLSIFTLIDLYQRTKDERYLESAKLAGDWLIKMQSEDGVVRPYLEYENGKWVTGEKESLLYNGQVLSALSRLYNQTKEEKYLKAAQKIANHFIKRIAENGCYLGDDYRSPNPISSAWVVMALRDFYRINPKETYKNIIFGCASNLLKRQLDDPTEPLYYGRWGGALSSSGNGWLAEVMTEIYHFCQQQRETDCEKYKTAVRKVIGWLIQNTYSRDNTSELPNPQRAIGGIFWNYDNKYVRTDSVCHALNAYLGIISDLL
ncbi:MAG: hypothetical protein DRH33_01685 [Candidatus Nealsonbacteria bacterium]|nr:MAG: hypothetical protein DRH33_01685 [Candidatus Nealsonbacteria bacterium]